MSHNTAKFPAGPIESSGIEKGIPWIVMRHTALGHCCGYVQLSEDHLWHRDYGASQEVVVHGGITGGQEGGWIGFDTAHARDVWPGTMFKPIGPGDIHWTVEMVADECRQLARRAQEDTQ